MFKNRVFQSKLVVYGLIGAFSVLALPNVGLSQTSMGSMTGFIFGADKTTPVESAVVKVRDIKTGREYQSMPTNEKGLYSVKNLPEGRYILGISEAKGDFNFDYQIMIKGGEIAKLAVALVPLTGTAQEDQNEEKKKKKRFFLTPLGIAVLVAAGALLVWGGLTWIVEGDKSPAKR